MTSWVRVETRFVNHPKVLDIGPLGEALWLRGLCYAGEQLTDGFVPDSYIRRMGDMKATAVAAKLVAAGLWDKVEGGYQIHDYLDWQRSRTEVDDISTKRAEAGRKGGKQKASNLLANGKQNASNGVADTYVDTDTEGETEITPLTPQGGTGVRDDAKPAVDAPDEEKPKAPCKPKQRTAPKYTPEFEAFWREYPNGAGKVQAFAEWQRVPDHDRDAVMEGLARWISSDRWQRGFVKEAYIWLRDRWWEDDPPPPAKPALAVVNGKRDTGVGDADYWAGVQSFGLVDLPDEEAG